MKRITVMGSESAMDKDSVFISYSKKDTPWLDKIKIPLRTFELEDKFNIWDDTKIKVSQDWNKEIESSIKRCKVAILLVSNNFLATEFILKKEIPGLLNRAQRDGARIFNVILDHNLFKSTALSRYQSLNNPDQPLSHLPKKELEKALVKLAEEVNTALLAVAKAKSLTVRSELPDFCQLAVILSRIVLAQCGRSISELQDSVTMSRRDVVASLDRLEEGGFIEPCHVDVATKRKPSKVWKATFLGMATHKNLLDQMGSSEAAMN